MVRVSLFNICRLGAAPFAGENTQDGIKKTFGAAAQADQDQYDNSCNHTNDDACDRPCTEAATLGLRLSTNEGAPICTNRSRIWHSRGRRSSGSNGENGVAGWSNWSTGDLSDSVEATVVPRAPSSTGRCALVDISHAVLTRRTTCAAARNLPQSILAVRRNNVILCSSGKVGTVCGCDGLQVCHDISGGVVLPIARVSCCGLPCLLASLNHAAASLVVAICKADFVGTTADLGVEAAWFVTSFL